MYDSEEELLCGAKEFDKRALSLIYDRYNQGLYVYAMRLLGNAYLAEECVSETFIRYLGAIKRGKGPKKYLQAYLYRIAHNWISDYYRGKSRSAINLEDQDENNAKDQSPLPNVFAEQQAQQTKIREVLWRLTPDQRQVILLKYYENWNNIEVARAIGKPVGAVKALQHRGLTRLRSFLKNEEI